jgi:hypothetical protein
LDNGRLGLRCRKGSTNLLEVLTLGDQVPQQLKCSGVFLTFTPHHVNNYSPVFILLGIPGFWVHLSVRIQTVSDSQSLQPRKGMVSGLRKHAWVILLPLLVQFHTLVFVPLVLLSSHQPTLCQGRAAIITVNNSL